MNDYSAIDERLRVCGTCRRCRLPGAVWSYCRLYPRLKRGAWHARPHDRCAFTPSEWMPYYEEDKERFQTGSET